MKTIKQLEKEIKERIKLVRDKGITEEDFKEFDIDEYSPESFWDGDIMMLELKLQTIKEVIKEIDEMKVISENHYGEDDGTDEIKLIKYLIDKEELINKLKGEGK